MYVNGLDYPNDETMKRPLAAAVGFDASKKAEFEKAKRPSSPRIVIDPDRDA